MGKLKEFLDMEQAISFQKNESGKNRVFIVSVGTSLIEKYNETQIEKQNQKPINTSEYNFQKIKFINKISFSNNPWAIFPINCVLMPDCLEYKTFKTFEGFLKTFLKNGNNFPEKSAELHSLFGESEFKIENQDQVILLPTLTPEGILCAKVLAEFLSENNFVSEIRVIKGLERAENENFSTEGLPNMLNSLSQWVESFREEGKEVIFVPTGGYKAIIPYFVLIGVLYRVPLIYIFEKSKTVLGLPRLPLGIDLEKWARERVHLELAKQDYDNWKNRIDEDFRPLLENKNGKAELTFLGEFFENYFQKVSGLTQLQIQTRATHLLDYLGSGYSQMFNTLVEIGPLLWKGDRLPEMVDHSAKHHYDLFLLAEKFLLPIFALNKQFLENWELFILLCSLYLHDCGHVLGTIKHSGKKIRLFPTEIRDFHHILGFERLKNFGDPVYFSQEIYLQITENGKSKKWGEEREKVWEKFLKPIAVVGLFHRKSMPLEEQGEPVRCFFWDEEADGPWKISQNSQNNLKIERNSLVFDGKELHFDRFGLLVSLLRIIDSLDSQVSRIGAKKEKAFHLAQLDCEIKEEEEKSEGLRKGLMDLGFNKNKICQIDSQIINEINGYNLKEGNKCTSNSEKIPATTLRIWLNEIEENGAKKVLEEYIFSKMKVEFKKLQKNHFEKHSKVKNLKIDSRKENNKLVIIIDLEMQEGKESEKAEVLKDLKSEYSEQVKDFLEKNGIELQYGGDSASNSEGV